MRKNIQMFVVFMILMNVLWVTSPTYGGSGFTGPYEMQNWSVTASNGGTATITPLTGSATSANFSYNINLGVPGSGVSFRTWTFSTTAASTGPVTFDWQYDFHHAWYDVRAVFQTYAMTSNGTITTTKLDFYNLEYTGPRSFNGTATINVEEGRPFGFIIGGSNFDWSSWLDGTLTITNFEYSEPEPIQDINDGNPKRIEGWIIDAVGYEADWYSSYDISYTNQEVTIELNIELDWEWPEDPDREQREQEWEEGIEGIWGNNFNIKDGTFEYPIIFEVNWVDVSPYIVKVHSGMDPSKEGFNIYNWYTDYYKYDKDNEIWILSNDFQDALAAHEAGHMFGLYDEYSPWGALDPTTAPTTYEYSIMADLARRTYDRHYQGILDWLKEKSNRNLVLSSTSLPGAPTGYIPPRVSNFSDPMPLIPEAPIPEPSTLVLVAFGLLAGIIMTKKYRKRI